MQLQDESPEDKPKLGLSTGLFSGGMLAMVVVCSGGHALLLGALGGLALGSVLGVGAGVLAAVLLVAGVIVVRRRRAATCALPREGRASA